MPQGTSTNPEVISLEDDDEQSTEQPADDNAPDADSNPEPASTQEDANSDEQGDSPTEAAKTAARSPSPEQEDGAGDDGSDSPADTQEQTDESTGEEQPTESDSPSDSTESDPETCTGRHTQDADGEADEAEEAEGEAEQFELIVETSVLKEAIGQVSPIVDELRLQLEADGIRMKAVDAANVAMVDTFVHEAALDHYQSSGGMLGLDISKFNQMVGMASSGDLIEMELTPDQKLDTNIGSLSFSTGLIDPHSIRQEPEIPDFDHEVEATGEANIFSRPLDAADFVGDNVRLKTPEDDREGLLVTADGDTDQVEELLGRDRLSGFDAGDGADSLFDLEYLQKPFSAAPNSAEVAVTLGNEFPVELNWEFAGGDATTTYVIAPRIES